MTAGLTVCMHAAQDAVDVVRAHVAGDADEAARILRDSLDTSALAANLAWMVLVAVSRLPDDVLEEYLTFTRRTMLDNALDCGPRLGSAAHAR